MKKIIITLFVISLFASSVFAEVFSKTGTADMQFLKITTDARAIGMGEAYVAVSDDISSTYWNPGGLALKEKNQSFFSHTEYVADIQFEYFSTSVYSDLGVFAFHAYMMHMDDMPIRTEQELDTGEKFTCMGLSTGLTYSRQFTDKFSFGFTAKYLREELYTYEVSTLAFDIGSQYNTRWRNLTIGMALSNFGGEVEFEVDDDNDGRNNEDPFDLLDNDGDGRVDEDGDGLTSQIPMNFSFGLSVDLMNDREDLQYLLGSLQINNTVDRRESFNLGFEYKHNLLYLRTGKQFNTDLEDRYDGFEAVLPSNYGIGVKIPTSIGIFNIDYAYSRMGWLEESFTQSAHRISVKMEY